MQVIKVEFQYMTTYRPVSNMYWVYVEGRDNPISIIACDELEAWQLATNSLRGDDQNTGSRQYSVL